MIPLLAHVGDRIRQLRHEAGLTQRQLAETLGVTPSYISKLENGTEEPGNSLLGFIALLFHVRPEWLNTGEPPRQRDLYEVLRGIVGQYGLAEVRQVLTRLASAVREEREEDAGLARMAEQLASLWSRSGPKERIWMEVQFQRAFPEAVELTHRDDLA